VRHEDLVTDETGQRRHAERGQSESNEQLIREWKARVRDVRRIIVVRHGATDVYDEMQKRYGSRADTIIVYDRRTGTRPAGREAPASERRPRQRRFPEPKGVLESRGYLIVRVRPDP
jgi:hypothetical protein